MNNVSRIAYRASANTAGLAASSKARDESRLRMTAAPLPSHAVVATMASAATAGARRAPNSSGRQLPSSAAWNQWKSDRFVEERLVVVERREPVARSEKLARGLRVMRFVGIPERRSAEAPEQDDKQESATRTRRRSCLAIPPIGGWQRSTAGNYSGYDFLRRELRLASRNVWCGNSRGLRGWRQWHGLVHQGGSAMSATAAISSGTRTGSRDHPARARACAVRQAGVEAARQVDVARAARDARRVGAGLHLRLGAFRTRRK